MQNQILRYYPDDKMVDILSNKVRGYWESYIRHLQSNNVNIGEKIKDWKKAMQTVGVGTGMIIGLNNE